MKNSKPKRFVEIYFVLYLAALILLIPDKKHEERRASDLVKELLQSSFTIQPEHNVLMCRVIRSGDSLRIVSCDSLNTIYHSGAVEDVSYEFSIEDQSYKNRIVLKSTNDRSASNFYLRGNAEEGSIHFAWTPATSDRRNRLYKVTVRATARPRLPLSLSDEQRNYLNELSGGADGLHLHAETQFNVALLYVDGGAGSSGGSELNPQILAQSDTSFRSRYEELLRQMDRPNTALSNPSTFYLQAQEQTVYSVAYLPFENRVHVYGADAQHEIEGLSVQPNGRVRVDGQELVVSSTTPASGITTYTLSARRASDHRDTTITFRVITKSLESPVVPSKMYPGLSYQFNPNFPEQSSGVRLAVLLDDKNNQIAQSVQGESFQFKPTLDDTSRFFRFERSINGHKVGQTLSIGVIPFPAPEIIDVAVRGGQVLVRTRSYGLESDTKARVKIELIGVLQGSRVQELYGDYRYDPAYNAHLQVFRFQTPSVSVGLRAVNGYKRSSERRDLSPHD